MNYATQNNIGDYQVTRTATATSFTPTVGRVCKLDAKTKGCKRTTERQTKIRSHSDVANGFLKYRFLPKLRTGDSVQPCQKTERDFYKSLSIVAKKYNTEPLQTRSYGYPYNMALAMWDMQMKLKRAQLNWDSLHLAQSSRKTFLATKDSYDTETTLYYIPIVPLFLMLKDPKKKKNAQLLVSVCSYLYRIADIPYYRQEGTFLHGHYDMHREWLEQEETDDTENCKSKLREADYIGDRIEQKLRNPNNLKIFEQRLSRFKTCDTFDHECWRIACNAFAFYTQYPKTSIFRNAPICEKDPYDPYDCNIIAMEKYISFCADTKGWLYEKISECVNNEFNECGEMEEPTLYKPLDGSRIAGNNFDFETSLFGLLDDLCGLLYDYKNE